MTRLVIVLALVAGCAQGDPCTEVDGTCLTIELRGDVGLLDEVGVTLTGAVSFEQQGAPPGGALPLLIGIAMPSVDGEVQVAGIGLRKGALVAAGDAAVEITVDHHSRRTVTLTETPPM